MKISEVFLQILWKFSKYFSKCLKMISIFVLNNPFRATSGAKFVYACGSPSHKPVRVVGMVQARHLTSQDTPPTWHEICQTSDATCQAMRCGNKAKENLHTICLFYVGSIPCLANAKQYMNVPYALPHLLFTYVVRVHM